MGFSEAYFAFTGKETGEVVFFLRSEDSNGEFTDDMMCFLREVFTWKKITHAEAETYEAFGVAPIIGANDLGMIVLNWQPHGGREELCTDPFVALRECVAEQRT